MRIVDVLVMAPNIGRDLSFIAEVAPHVRVLDGNAAFAAELEAEETRATAGEPSSGILPSLEERDALLVQADVLLISHPVLKNIASRAPRLKWVHHTQAGVSNYWRSDLWESRITLTSSRGFVAPDSIAQYVITGALFFARGLYDAYLDKRTGGLDRSHYQTTRLDRTTMGIVGLGGIGKEVARLAHSLSMRVVATRRSVASPQQNVDGADLLLPANQLEEVAAQSDFLAICAALTDETDGLINRDVFRAMKPSAVFINVSRGEVVDEDDLIDALRRGKIRGAVMDVFRGELGGGQPRHELMELPQVFVTSPVSATGSNFGDAVRELFRENLRRFLNDEPLMNVVDRERGY